MGRSWVLFLGLCLGLFLFGRGSSVWAQGGGEVSEQAFWDLVMRTEEVMAAEEGEMPALLSLSHEWAAIHTVALSDGSKISVDGTYLANRLQAENLDQVQLQNEMQAWLAAQKVWAPPEFSTQAGQSANRQLAEILAQPAFQWGSEEPLLEESLVDQLLNRLLAFLGRILPGQGTASVLGWGVSAIAGILLIFVLLYILRYLVQDVVGEAQLDLTSSANDPLTSQAAHQQAQNSAGIGDYRAAVRYLYLACLLSLDERGLLRYDRSLTNREVVRTVAHLPELAGLLGEVVELFDRVWYGFQPITESTYRQYETRVHALQEEK